MNLKTFVQATVSNVRQFFRSMMSQQDEKTATDSTLWLNSGEAHPLPTTSLDRPTLTMYGAEDGSKPLPSKPDGLEIAHPKIESHKIIDVAEPTNGMPLDIVDRLEMEPPEADLRSKTNDNPAEQLLVPTPALEETALPPLTHPTITPSPNHNTNTAQESAYPPLYLEVCGEKLLVVTVLESLLFVADSPIDPAAIARLLHYDTATIEANLQILAQMYQDEGRGLRLQERNGKFQLVTLPAVATIVEDFLNLETTTKLSGPALETLAVIAYRQPITRMQVEAVRGVDSAGVLRSLTQRGLVEEMGRLEVVGRPILYGVTDLFMQHFGLMKLGELPPLELSEADTLWATTKLAELNGVSN